MKSPGKSSGKAANLVEQLAYTGDGVFAVDRNYHIVLWNQAAEALLGYSAQEAVGKNCFDVIQGCDHNGVSTCGKQCCHFEAAKSLRWLPSESFYARSKNGTHVWINVTTLSVLSQRRKLSALVHIFRNVGGITGLHERRKELPVPAVKSLSGSAVPIESPLPKDNGNSPSASLSGREHAILCHLAEGLSTKAIGDRLYISPITVKNHVQSILKKLQVHSRVEAIVLAFHQGLV